MSDWSPREALTTLRVLWWFLLVEVVAFAAIVLMLVGMDWVAIVAETWGPVLTRTAAGAVVILTCAGYYIRNQCYKSGWREHAVTADAYFKGNFILLAMLELAAMFALGVMLVTGWLLLPGMIVAATLAVQLVNFPTGKAMQPRRPSFADDHR